MPDKSDPRYDPRPFKCEHCGKVLGWIVRRGNATHLDILRIPHKPGSPMPVGLSQWSFRGEVLKGHVPCVCGKSRKWSASQAAIERLLPGPEAVKHFRKLTKECSS